jgi:hypothetical protein
MKQRILTLSLVFLFAVTAVFTGCKKDSSTDPAATTPTPTLTLNSDPGFTATSATVAPGTPFKFGFVAVPVSGSKIVEYKVTYAYDGGAAVNIVDSANQSFTSLARQYTRTTRTAAGTETYSVTVTDKNGQTATSSFTLTVQATPATASQSGTLGAVSNAAGSFFDATNGVVYTETVAGGKSNLVDFAYFSSSSTSTGIGAISDAAVASAYSHTTTWTTKNATKITKSANYTASNFAAVTDAQIAALATPTTTVVNSIAAGDVLEFQTVNNKKGLIKIGSITPGASGSVMISVKVQK